MIPLLPDSTERLLLFAALWFLIDGLTMRGSGMRWCKTQQNLGHSDFDFVSGFGLRASDLVSLLSFAPDEGFLAEEVVLAVFLGAGFLRLRLRRFLGGASLDAVFVSGSVFFASLVSALLPLGLAAAFFLGGAKPKNSPG